ncbi:squalene/phytoene synthase family protein [Methylosinus sp. H3A]|uniref:phytoene/squalene synthase family protein n=1 Tax=Methylosinus sp. H3A TaxID=2785786 RepID=UPI0018C301F8|nr:squalene/phytoene synthase family protein [Methylosinus sp. H3A]MBG0811316.1 squalene/phytoene synthase family protein [Methylosinus sp. H3A]
MDDAAAKRETELADHYRHCEAALREQELDLWLAGLFAPASARPHLHAIGAFAAELASVRARVSQPILGEMRLRWWYDSLEAAADSEGARAHPVADALFDTLDRHAIPREEIVELLEAHSFDLYDEPMESLAALETYCDRVFGAPMRWRAIAIDAQDASRQEEALRCAGRALGLTSILRALPRHLAQGQRFLPVDLLARHSAEADFAEAKATPAVAGALAELRGEARDNLEKARSAVHGDGPARAALLPAALIPLYLGEMERKGFEPFHTIAEPAQWRRQWRLWRASRGRGI